ncbi:MAG: hypothetical protein JST68_08250, partial [Bacteroidetes bacterium]|nr:hypothetical protein [Bacteroidota bacterium]
GLSLARYSLIADRYAYVPSIGLCFIAGYAFTQAFTKHRQLLSAVALVYIASLMIYAHSHLGVWNSAYSLKEKLKSTIEERKDFNELKLKYN